MERHKFIEYVPVDHKRENKHPENTSVQLNNGDKNVGNA